MSGFGLAPFGTGVFGTWTPDTVPTTSGQIVSSRKFDASGNPTQVSDGSGAFAGESDALSRARILLLTSRQRTSIITASWESDERKRIENALAVLTKPPAPLVEIVRIDTASSGSTGQSFVVLRDLTNGGREVVVNASPRYY